MEDLLQKSFSESFEQFERTVSMDNLSTLKDLNLLDEIKYVCAMPGLINVVFEDYSTLLEGRSIVCYSKCELKTNEKLIINNVVDKIPTCGIIFITCSENIKLSEIMAVLNNVFDKYPDMDLIYGTGYNDDLKDDEIRVFGLFAA